MTKINAILNSRQTDSGYYQLQRPKSTLWSKIAEVVMHCIYFPYHVYQIAVGRLLSYLVLNPLFRKNEKNKTSIEQHHKHPDPLFQSTDEMYIINVIPQDNILIKVAINWHNFLANHSIIGKIVDGFFHFVYCIVPLDQTFSKYFFKQNLNQLIANIETVVEKKNLQFSQIHLHGMERLNEKQKQKVYKELQNKFHHDFRQNLKRVYFYTLQTTDNALLDSVELRPEHNADKDITNRKFIIACMPRNNNYKDWIKNYTVYANELNATVITFNYRGIGQSLGIITSELNLYSDARAQVERLILLGARPENIALMGECLGANIATYTAGSLQQDGYPVKLYNARSFRSIPAIIEGFIKPQPHASALNPLTCLKWCGYALSKTLINPILYSAQWSMSVEKQFLAIPHSDRDFLVVRSKKNKEGKRFADDLMIPHKEASIYSLVKKNRKQIAQKKIEGHTLSLEEQARLDDVLKQHKFQVNGALHKNAHKANGHVVHSRLLMSTNSTEGSALVDGRMHSMNFFKRIWKNNNADSASPSRPSYSC